MNHGEIVSFIWGVADLIRDTFKRGKYQDVILPLTVLRRLDCVLSPTKEKVLATLAKYKGKGLENVGPLLRRASGFAFYNTSRYDFEKLLADAPNVAANLRNYIKGFSPNMQEVIEKFDFDNTITRLHEAGLLFKVLERFKNVDLHPDKVSNPTMGTIFEELIRRFNEALNENPGEHFTPHERLAAMPEQLFYNTGIATYVWVLTNRKARERKGKVQLLDATSFWAPMRRGLGDKRREIPPEKAVEILAVHREFKEGGFCKIFPTTHFGYRKITVERPLRLNFRASKERIARLDEESAFQSLARSAKKDPKARVREEAEGRALQEAIRKMLAGMPDTLFKDREKFLGALGVAAKRVGLKLTAPVRKAILGALSERDETAEVCRDEEGHPEPDPELRDTENVPLEEPIEAYFEREVKPYVPDAWINTAIRDEKDSQVGRVGYEINFNRYFYKYQPPRPLDAIEADIRVLEGEILTMLREFGGGNENRPSGG